MRRVYSLTRALLPLPFLLAGGCGDAREVAHDGARDERAGGVAVVCASTMPESLDPFVSPDLIAADLRHLLFTPLVLYDNQGGVSGYLAHDWEWGEEQRSLILKVRQDMHWHDGQPVTAEDVVWTIQAAADSTYAYPAWGDFQTVRDAVVRDAETVEVLFDAPFGAGLEPFTQLPILPRHLLDGMSAAEFARAEYHRSPVGSGPFQLTGRAPDGSLQFDRFAGFPEELGRALLDRIVFRGIVEPSSMMIELATGGVDLCVTGSSMANDIEAAPQLDALALDPRGVQVIQLSVAQPPFRDARVRRALSAALHRADLAASISPLARPARTYLYGVAERWADPDILEPDADSALAAALLDSTEWRTLGADGIRRNLAGERLRFTITAPQAFQSTLTVVQAQLRRVGMDAQLRFMESASFISLILDPATRPAAMAISLFPERLMLPDPPTELHSSGGANFTGYSDPATDSLIDRLGMLIPDEERSKIYRELQQRLADEVPIVYLASFPRVLARGPRLEGVETDLNGPFTSASQWWIPEAQRRRGTTPPRRDTATAATVTPSRP